MPTLNFSRDLKVAIIILIIAFLGRAVMLEYNDLLDPTESRYASISQEMVTSNNWLTPMLPMPNGIEPYLGKPPLHFWLTAISYEVFGVDEWSARLPSFLASVGLTILVFLFGRRLFGEKTATTSSLIFASTGMVFLLAGASIIDVTLTIMVTTSIMTLYLFLFGDGNNTKYIYLSAFFASLAFLTKGPVALVLIWLPFLLYSIFNKDFSWVRKIPWVMSINIFIVCVIPWFILSEIQNPGFIKYFIWNENIGRYLFKNYGDKYGSGHVHPYGASWVMLAMAFMPWTLVLLYNLIVLRIKGFKQIMADTPHFKFLICWTLTAPIFFTLVRQLHTMYLLPAIPPISMLCGVFFVNMVNDETTTGRSKYNLSLNWLMVLFGIILIIIGGVLEYSFKSLLISTFVLIMSVLILSSKRFFEQTRYSGDLLKISIQLFSIYLIFISSFSSFINSTCSTEELLRKILLYDKNNSSNVPIGINTENTFSHYWATKAWSTELGERATISYITPSEMPTANVKYFMVKAKKVEKVPIEVSDNFRLLFQSGKWFVYIRKDNFQHIS